MRSMRIAARMGWLSVAVGVSLAGPGAGPAGADEVKVFSAGAVRAIVTELAQAFRQETGHTVTPSFGPVGVTRRRLASAEPVDVVIMTDVAVDDVAKQGAVVPGTRADLARTGMGVGVHEGAPKPDIGTSDAFKATLLNAKSIVYVDPAPGATSGIHFASVLDRLGIAEAVKGKVYSAGLAARSAKPEAARAFIAFLARPAFKPKFAAAGLDYRP